MKFYLVECYRLIANCSKSSTHKQGYWLRFRLMFKLRRLIMFKNRQYYTAYSRSRHHQTDQLLMPNTMGVLQPITSRYMWRSSHESTFNKHPNENNSSYDIFCSLPLSRQSHHTSSHCLNYSIFKSELVCVVFLFYG